MCYSRKPGEDARVGGGTAGAALQLGPEARERVAVAVRRCRHHSQGGEMRASLHTVFIDVRRYPMRDWST